MAQTMPFTLSQHVQPTTATPNDNDVSRAPNNEPQQGLETCLETLVCLFYFFFFGSTNYYHKHYQLKDNKERGAQDVQSPRYVYLLPFFYTLLMLIYLFRI